MLSNAHIIDVNESNLQTVIEQSMQLPVVFYFYSERSPHCQELGTTLERITSEYADQLILAKVDCDQEQLVASQFGLRAIPTVYLLRNGQPVDGFQGPQPEDVIRNMLAQVLPSPAEMKASQAIALMDNGSFADALPLLREACALDEKNSEINLLLAQTLIELNQLDEAEKVLKLIPLQDQDTRYQGFISQIELKRQAADTPEIQELSQKFEKDPENAELGIQLALSLHETHRNEEALELLYAFLRKDLNAADGNVKKTLMDIMAAMGTSDATASRYRRLVYSLLY